MQTEKHQPVQQSSHVRSIEQLGNVIKRFRKLQKISQIELAKKAGVTQKTISNIESNSSKATIGTLLLVLSALKLDLMVIERAQNNIEDLEGLY